MPLMVAGIWSGPPPRQFVNAVLNARQRYAGVLTSDAAAEAFVATHLPRPWRYLRLSEVDTTSTRPSFEPVPYASIIHNRADLGDDIPRVAVLVRALMRDIELEGFLEPEVLPYAGELLVLSGNRRIVAQQLVGIDPWVTVLRPEA